ncbi:GntR family transcriptional regulator [Streptomyces sp. Edi2]|uniref:GntR family transcriptional regulator n=1 Tax=Streptomyces sp. Edi2 TaxID=3162528 RepID=UPI0033060D32
MTDAPASPRPKHTRIADKIRAAIDAGDLQPGQRLPSEDELAAEHRVSHVTAARAVALLKVQGYLEGRRGSGVYVQKQLALTHQGLPYTGGDHWGDGNTIWQTTDGQSLDVDCVAAEEVTPPDEVARALRLGESDTVLRHAARFSLGRRPVKYVRTFLPHGLVDAKRTDLHHIVPGDIAVTLKALGQQPSRIYVEGRSQMPSSEDVDLLSIPADRFVLRLYRIAYDAARNPIGVEETTMDAAAYVLAYDYPA